MENMNPLDIVKRLDIRHNVTIRVLDDATGKVIQEHEGHNAATNSMLTGIAHYLVGDGVLNQGADMLSTWVPQYISVGTMGLTSQDSEEIVDIETGNTIVVPKAIGSTPCVPDNATEEEIKFNAQTRFEEYINQAPGFGADGYDFNTNNNREWFGLGYPYNDRPYIKTQDFYTSDGSTSKFYLSKNPESIISVVVYDSIVDGSAKSSAHSSTIPAKLYAVGKPITQSFGIPDDPTQISSIFKLEYKSIVIDSVLLDGVAVDYTYTDYNNSIHLLQSPEGASELVVNYLVEPSEDIVAQVCVYIRNRDDIPVSGTRVAIMYYTADGIPDAVNCELITSNTVRSQITYRNIIPEVQSEIPDTIDVVYSAFLSTGALAQFRGDNDYIYITEVGLWSKPTYNNSGDNGLLAGYRIMPTDDEPAEINQRITLNGDGTNSQFVLPDEKAISVVSVTVDNEGVPDFSFDYKTKKLSLLTENETEYIPAEGAVIMVVYTVTNSWKDMSIEANRQAVQKNIIRIGKNQVAQVIWKLQLGGLEQLNGLRYIYPSQYPEDVWEVWTST